MASESQRLARVVDECVRELRRLQWFLKDEKHCLEALAGLDRTKWAISQGEQAIADRMRELRREAAARR